MFVGSNALLDTLILNTFLGGADKNAVVFNKDNEQVNQIVFLFLFFNNNFILDNWYN